ncbi:MAG: carbohydrate-binding family 9-like protein, partial [Desulfobacterales bacterium]|nr:carbohydrate-binding family 9-like protein [Desulfobacterales bacterium]
MEYEVHRAGGIFDGDGTWDGAFWKNIPGLKLKNHMGDYPVHFPETRAKLCYDDLALYLIFQVRDQYVRAVAQENQGRVWEDSCVEFFFTPGPELSDLYFNLEMNCAGVLLCHFHAGDGSEAVPLSTEDCHAVETVSTFSGPVAPEIQSPTNWVLACT